MKIRQDELYALHSEGLEAPVMVNAKYDRIDHFPELGHWILKVFDDEKGLMGLHIDEATALSVVEFAELPIIERKFIYQSEYDGYLLATQSMMDEWKD
jgi:hypothetical protein